VANSLLARADTNPTSLAPVVPDPAVPALFAQALAHHRAGRLSEAVGYYHQILALAPELPEVHTNLGAALAAMGKLADAEVAYRSAIRLKPDYVQAHNNLGNTLKSQGKFNEAEAALRRAIALMENYPEAYSNLGVVLFGLGRLEDAEAAYRRAIALKPDFAAAYNNLGNVLRDLGRLDDAAAACCRAITLQPDYPDAYANLGNTLKDLGSLEASETVLRKAIALRPDHAEAHSNLGNVLMDQGRLKESAALLRHAIALKPDFAGAYNNLGLALKELGRFDEARRATEEAIRLAPRKASYYCNLGELTHFAADDPHVAAMEALAATPGSLSTTDQIALHFALAKAYEHISWNAIAFRQLLTGNALKRRHIAYDEAAESRQMDRVAAVFTPELMRSHEGVGEPSRVPVFIVGMLRSGTTLVEQILASHPAVFGAGELKLFDAAAAGVAPAAQGSPGFPDIASTMSGEQFRELGARYLVELMRLAPDAARITDKMPSNFVYAGLIHLALPNAVIIHTVRDPVDTCVSCFSKLFSEGQKHTYDLAELGRYYRRYQSLMAHWRRVLPPGRILDVRYEDVVADLEGASRRILAHCGLPWDARCLEFHRTERPIRTASATQVRQPIYKSAIGRRRAYEEFLGPLVAELEPTPPSATASAA
jgi:Flp pilus assembly protein TadD